MDNFQDKINEAVIEIRKNHLKIIDDWCKSYLAQLYKEGKDIDVGCFTLNEQDWNFPDHKIGKRYWFEEGKPDYPKYNLWISVKERLPMIGEVCILYITYPNGTMFNCRADPLQRNFTKIGGLRYNGIFVSYEDQYNENGLKYVSHWMPLPNPPEVKDE